jgi:hypothetical protein
MNSREQKKSANANENGRFPKGGLAKHNFQDDPAQTASTFESLQTYVEKVGGNQAEESNISLRFDQFQNIKSVFSYT